MRRIALAALLAAVAMPAWAYNDRPSAVADDWKKTVELCIKAGGDNPTCHWQHNPDETAARDSALIALVQICEVEEPTARQCPIWRAYIKQRWGY